MQSDHVIGARKEDILRVTKEDNKDIKFTTAKDFLKNTKVSALFPPNRQKIITTTTKTPITETLQTLISNNILSVPVKDEMKGQYVAFIDMLDIVVDMMDTLKEAEITGGGFLEILKGSERLKKHLCGDVAGSSGRNPYYPIQENAPLLSALQIMAEQRVHRIPAVSTEGGDLLTIITQSHVVDLLVKNAVKFNEIMKKTISELNMGLKEVRSIDKKQRAIDAFKIIYENKVTGVAVVDGKDLVGNISTTDVRLMGSNIENLSRLFWPAEEYIRLNQKPAEDQVIPTPYCVVKNSTFEEVVMKLHLTRTHRVYVIDEISKAPIGVISLTDLLDALVKNYAV